MSQAWTERINTHAASAALEHLVEQHQELMRREALFSEAQAVKAAIRSAPERKRKALHERLAELKEQASSQEYVLDILCAHDPKGLNLILPTRGGDGILTKLIDAVVRELAASYAKPLHGKVLEFPVAGFNVISAPYSERRFDTFIADVQAEPRLKKAAGILLEAAPQLMYLITCDSLSDAALELTAKEAAVNKGAIGIPSERIRTFFPNEKEAFTLKDKHGNQWRSYVASNKISKGITELVQRENERFARQGQRPFGNGDRIVFLRLPNMNYYIELHKAVGTQTAPNANDKVTYTKAPSGAETDAAYTKAAQHQPQVSRAKRQAGAISFPVVKTLLAYNTINVPREHIGNGLPGENVRFTLEDRTGKSWQTRITSSKLSIGVGAWCRRENDFLKAAGEKPITAGDTYIFTPAGKLTYNLEVQKDR